MNEIYLKTIPPFKVSLISEEDEIASLRKDMMRFAANQLRNEQEAEDAVQDALISAISGLGNFRNQSKLKAWVFSILSNKIKDTIKARIRSKRRIIDVLKIEDIQTEKFFDADGEWSEEACTAHWETPEKSFSNQQFWGVFEACLNRLPENTSRVFMMREILGLETSEICKELGIKANNCAQVLFRARLSLSACMNERWFNNEGYVE